MKIAQCGVWFLFLGLAGGVRAEWAARMESAYLGGGQFQYHVEMHHGAVIPGYEFASISFQVPTDVVISASSPDGWEFSGTNGNFSITQYEPVPEPFEHSCLIQTDADGCSTGRMYVMFICPMLIMSRCEYGPWFVISRNMAGYMRFDCLIPAKGEGVQQAPTNLPGACTMIYDPACRIAGANELVFYWTNSESTVLIEASSNLTSWNAVGCALGTDSATGTVWTSPVPLMDLGQFFRVQLLSGARCQNMVDDFYSNRTAMVFHEASASLPDTGEASFRMVQIQGSYMLIDADTQPGLSYVAWVEPLGGGGRGAQTTVVAQDVVTRIALPLEGSMLDGGRVRVMLRP